MNTIYIPNFVAKFLQSVGKDMTLVFSNELYLALSQDVQAYVFVMECSTSPVLGAKPTSSENFNS